MSGLDALRQRLADFARERAWERFHTPKNLTMALTGEAAELVEHFQWRGDDEPLPPEALPEVEQEIADVLIYLVRLADVLDVDLVAAVQRKMAINEQRFPATESATRNTDP